MNENPFRSAAIALVLATIAAGGGACGTCLPEVPRSVGPRAPPSTSHAARATDPADVPQPRLSNHDRKLMEWERIRKRVARFRDVAQGIVVDGDSGDWAGFFWSRSTVRRPRDGVPMTLSLAIAPTEREILFCLRSETQDPDSWDQWRYIALRIEAESREFEELALTVQPGRPTEGESRTWAWLRWRADSTQLIVPSGSVRHVRGACIEGRVDLAALLGEENELSVRVRRALLARPFVRVSSSLFESQDASKRDPGWRRQDGPAVSSYWLSPEGFAPTWAEPTPVAESARGSFFLRGRWYVVAGQDYWKSHLGRFAYDFAIRDERGCSQPDQSQGGKETRFAWNQVVKAPRDGLLRAVADDNPDREVPEGLSRAEEVELGERVSGESNWLELSEGSHLWRFTHLKHGSALQPGGRSVKRGDPIARVGNSGCLAPHLHVEAARHLGASTVPIVLEDIAVGLNAAEDDPWEVTLPEWEVEAGYFVREAQPDRR